MFFEGKRETLEQALTRVEPVDGFTPRQHLEAAEAVMCFRDEWEARASERYERGSIHWKIEVLRQAVRRRDAILQPLKFKSRRAA